MYVQINILKYKKKPFFMVDAKFFLGVFLAQTLSRRPLSLWDSFPLRKCFCTIKEK